MKWKLQYLDEEIQGKRQYRIFKDYDTMIEWCNRHDDHISQCVYESVALKRPFLFRLKLLWIQLRLKWKNRSVGSINYKIVDLNVIYNDQSYVYCNGEKVYDLVNKKMIKHEQKFEKI